MSESNKKNVCPKKSWKKIKKGYPGRYRLSPWKERKRKEKKRKERKRDEKDLLESSIIILRAKNRAINNEGPNRFRTKF